MKTVKLAADVRELSHAEIDVVWPGRQQHRICASRFDLFAIGSDDDAAQKLQ